MRRAFCRAAPGYLMVLWEAPLSSHFPADAITEAAQRL